ncbi:MAG: flagellar export protein FliJ [Magnetococcus sp. MYC-9]
MNRFKRLVELRRIREESKGLDVARLLGRLDGMRLELFQLDQQTVEEQNLARQAVSHAMDDASTPRLAMRLMDDFLRGQAWRRQHLEQRMAAAQQDLEQAKAAWITARTQLKQAEKLEEREKLHQCQQAELREKKMLDMIGVLRKETAFGQEGDVG